MSKLSKLWEKWSIKGLFLPFVHDPVTKKPSITLLFPYITFVLATISLVLLHVWPSMFIATVTSILFWVIATIFYMIRKINKSKIDLNDMSIEIIGEDSEKNP